MTNNQRKDGGGHKFGVSLSIGLIVLGLMSTKMKEIVELYDAPVWLASLQANTLPNSTHQPLIDRARRSWVTEADIRVPGWRVYAN